MNPSIKILTIITLCISLILSTTGCNSLNSYTTPINKQGFAFDTLVSITIYDSNNYSLLDECFNMCSCYENMLSKTVKGSDIYRINHANTEAVTVSDETITLLKYSIDAYNNYDQIFDISISPVSDIWTNARETSVLPELSSITNALANVNLSALNIDTKHFTVSKANPDLQIDLGGIAKGYIADKLKEYLISEGVTSAIISLGGNIMTIGSKPDGSSFTIGIKEPFSQTNSAIAALSITDKTVVTSGTYERYFINEGRIYHHIIDPATGYPANTDLNSVTIITDSSMQADVLSTLCIILGLEKAKEVINHAPGIEALFITSDNTIYYSDNAAQYIKQ